VPRARRESGDGPTAETADGRRVEPERRRSPPVV